MTLPMSLRRSITTTVSGGLRELIVRPAAQLPSLDALRSFAVLLVIGSHWAVVDFVRAGGRQVAIQDSAPFYYGWAGVDLFFVLSGLLIGKQLWRELERTGDIRLGRFLLRRGLRIWPIYFVMLAAYALTSSVVHPRWPDWTFLSNYFPPGFSRGWSLSTEEQFYIAVPLLLIAIRRRIPLAAYLWVFAGIETLVLVFRHLEIRAVLGAGIPYDRADFQLIYPFHVHLEALLAGLVIALLTVVRPAMFDPRRTPRLSRLGLGVLVGCTILALALRRMDQRLFAFVTLGLIFGGATFYALLDRSRLTAWLRWPVWYPISRLSYGMYLNHTYVTPTTNRLAVVAMRAVTSNETAVFLGSLVLVTLVSIAVAVVTFVVIEHPFLLLRERLFRVRAPEPAAAPEGVPIPAGAGIALATPATPRVSAGGQR